MQLHHIGTTSRTQSTQRVGRGGKRGKTSGHGTKGQKSRAGHKIRPEIRDRIKKIPKLRGHGKNRSRTVRTNRIAPVAVSLSTIEQCFEAGETVSPNILLDRGIVRIRRAKIKILANGSITKKVLITGCAVSKMAKKSIEAAGGTISNA
ncbi:MAG TPA: 50S ribosomal protein L15 [Candidatus Kaiserbacteria bacterium]|nr:50S ribosomal protein L15 [Candidatus Kaiserbacteria bacterium]